jgi:hypothetical protein
MWSCPCSAGVETNPADSERGRSQSPPAPGLSIPKNRSTGNLLANVPKSAEKARIRFSDAGLTAAEYDTMSRLVLSFRVLVGTSYRVGIETSLVSRMSEREIYLPILTTFSYQISGHNRTRAWAWGVWSAADTTTAPPSSSNIPLFRIFFSQPVCGTAVEFNDSGTPKPSTSILGNHLWPVFADAELYRGPQSISV